MYLISRFMSSYSMCYDEVLKLNWFVFNSLLSALNVVEAEQNYDRLAIADNHLLANAKDKDKIQGLYDRYKKVIEKGVRELVDHDEEWQRLMANIRR